MQLPSPLLRPSKFALKLGVVLMGVVLMSACQSSPKPAQAHGSVTHPTKASDVFARYQQGSDATAKDRLVAAIKAHLGKERVSVSEYYYQEHPRFAKDSLNVGADPVWISIMKTEDYEVPSPESQDGAYRESVDYLDGDGLYLRYYDEVWGSLPSDDYALSRLDGLSQSSQDVSYAVGGLRSRYRSCVLSASYKLDEQVRQNPAITTDHHDVAATLDELTRCTTKAEQSLQALLDKSNPYQAQDIRHLGQCVSAYQTNIRDALSRGRTLVRYEGEDYDKYDSVYGQYALCNLVYETAYRSDPAYYLEMQSSQAQLDQLVSVRRCANANRERLALVVSAGDTYKTAPKVYETSFYQYFECLSETTDDLPSQEVTSMAQVKEIYAQYLQSMNDDDDEYESDGDDENMESHGLLEFLFGDYFKMKQAELSGELHTPKLGISGIYGMVASEWLEVLKKTPEQMLAKNLYQYDNTKVTVLSHHNPNAYQSQGVVSLDFDSPTASQSLRLPVRADFLTGKVVADLSPMLPIGALLFPEATPLPEDFEGQVGAVSFYVPKELTELVPPKLIYQSLERGVGQAFSELNAGMFTAVDITGDDFAQTLGATQVVKLTLTPAQFGEFVSLVSKQLIKDLTAHVQTHPELFLASDIADVSVAEELAQKAQNERAAAIKDAIEKWALLDKGHTSSDVGGLVAAIIGIAPIDFYQANYYYLDRQGRLVGRVMKGEMGNRIESTHVMALTRYDDDLQTFYSHPLATSLGFDSQKVLDGNAWFAALFDGQAQKSQAELLRESYEAEQVSEAIADALLESVSTPTTSHD